MNYKETYSSKRQLNRLGLQTFFLNLEHNHFKNAIDKLLIEKEIELNSLKSKKESLKNFKDFDNEIDNEFGIMFLEKELFAITEMKISYTYKHFETHLKFLIAASFPNIKESELYKWDFMTHFLNSKNIKIKEIENYNEINELREVNNSIKHSRSLINNKTKNIKEFNKTTNLTYVALNLFYTRIENSSRTFLTALAYEIEKDLYEFDDERLENMAAKIALRMDETTINNLISKINRIN